MLTLSWSMIAHGQVPRVHYFHDSNMPPGVVGQQQLLRGAGLPGYFQAVDLLAPEGVQISVVVGGQFDEPRPAPLLVGMQIGYVYQFKVTNIPFREGVEVYPTVELINRLYPPEGKKLRFPVPIELTTEELDLAIAGQYVTRVIYLEDPSSALPQLDDPRHQRYTDVGPSEDPLHAADRLGRPLAILRMGSRVPDNNELAGLPGFGCPPIQIYPRPAEQPTAKAEGAAAAVERHGQDIPRLAEETFNPRARQPAVTPYQK